MPDPARTVANGTATMSTTQRQTRCGAAFTAIGTQLPATPMDSFCAACGRLPPQAVKAVVRERRRTTVSRAAPGSRGVVNLGGVT